MKPLIVLLSAGLVAGCASNDFSKFYSDHIGNAPSGFAEKHLEPYSGKSVIQKSANMQESSALMEDRNYYILGESGFTGSGKVTEDQLLAQARKVGADIVIYGIYYEGAEVGTVPVLQYNPGTTSTTNTYGTVNATASGSGGYGRATANYSGTSTTNTIGTFTTQQAQRTFHRYTHAATFWRKGKPRVFGVHMDVLPNEIRASLQRNTGVIIRSVVNDGPAFRANILKGDVLIAIGGEEVFSPESASAILAKFAGQKVMMTVIRNGKTQEIQVALNAAN